MSSNLDFYLINEIKSDTGLELIYNFRNIKFHVGIAAAVTSYPRIEMLEFKTLPAIKIYYTDIESIIIEGNIPPELIGEDLSQMKDELGGGILKKAYILGIKICLYQR
jgi:hypothetical protein